MEAGVNIGKDIANIAKRFMAADYADAIGDSLIIATNVLFGQYHGSKMETNKYAIAIGSQGGIKRIDTLIYLKKISGKRLQEVSKNILMFCYMVSSVKI